MHFLVEYDRQKGQLINLRRYTGDDITRVQDDRLETELAHLRACRDIEVVLLEAENEEALRRTHRRYFEQLRELANANPEPYNPPGSP